MYRPRRGRRARRRSLSGYVRECRPGVQKAVRRLLSKRMKGVSSKAKRTQIMKDAWREVKAEYCKR